MIKYILYTALLLTCLLSGFALAADIPVSEPDIEDYITTFDQPALEGALTSFHDAESGGGFGHDEYYRMALIYEGLLRIHEVHDNSKMIDKIARTGEKYAKKAIAKEPEHSDSHRLLSRFYAKQLNWSNGFDLGPKVMEELDLAIKYDPENPKAILGKIAVYLYAPPMFGGNVDLALKKLVQYTETYPDSEDGFINLGIAYKFKGDKAKARAIFETILQNNPHNLTAVKELQQISGRR